MMMPFAFESPRLCTVYEGENAQDEGINRRLYQTISIKANLGRKYSVFHFSAGKTLPSIIIIVGNAFLGEQRRGGISIRR